MSTPIAMRQPTEYERLMGLAQGIRKPEVSVSKDVTLPEGAEAATLRPKRAEDTSGGTGAQGAGAPPEGGVDFYNYMSGLVTPVSAQEQERRERGARTAQAIGHLGNAFSALSNLIFTGQGAVPQRLPEVADPNVSEWQERLDEQRARYAEAGLAASQAAARQEYDNWKRRNDYEQQLLENRMAQDAARQKQEMFEFEREQARIDNEQKEAALNETIRSHKAGEAIDAREAATREQTAELNAAVRQQQALARMGYSIGADGKPVPKTGVMQGYDGKYYDYNEAQLISILGQLYQLVPPESRTLVTTERADDRDVIMMQDVLAAAQQKPEVMQQLENAGIAVARQPAGKPNLFDDNTSQKPNLF